MKKYLLPAFAACFFLLAVQQPGAPDKIYGQFFKNVQLQQVFPGRGMLFIRH